MTFAMMPAMPGWWAVYAYCDEEGTWLIVHRVEGWSGREVQTGLGGVYREYSALILDEDEGRLLEHDDMSESGDGESFLGFVEPGQTPPTYGEVDPAATGEWERRAMAHRLSWENKRKRKEMVR